MQTKAEVGAHQPSKTNPRPLDFCLLGPILDWAHHCSVLGLLERPVTTHFWVCLTKMVWSRIQMVYLVRKTRCLCCVHKECKSIKYLEILRCGSTNKTRFDCTAKVILGMCGDRTQKCPQMSMVRSTHLAVPSANSKLWTSLFRDCSFLQKFPGLCCGMSSLMWHGNRTEIWIYLWSKYCLLSQNFSVCCCFFHEVFFWLLWSLRRERVAEVTSLSTPHTKQQQNTGLWQEKLACPKQNYIPWQI